MDSVHMATNPCAMELDGVQLLGTSGQNLHDVMRYVETEDEMVLAQCMLKWAHLSPTCPDTVPGYPFRGSDPFLCRQRPHVFFIGGAKRFQTCMMAADDGEGAGTLIVLVPRFADTHTVVSVDLTTLAVEELAFEMDVELEGLGSGTQSSMEA
jgi:DNA polymerase delta subunit 2